MKLIIHFIFLVTAAACAALATTSASKVDPTRALSYIEVLASDSLQGRRSGLPGGEHAAAWIADQFRSWGLRPGMGDSSYFQNFAIPTAFETSPMVMTKISAVEMDPANRSDTIVFSYGSDFVSFAYGGSGRVSGDLVFIGYGIQAPEKGRDDLAGLNLKGKIALALAGAPDEGEGFWSGGEGFHGYKAAHAADAGAAGYLQVGSGKAMQRTLGAENRRDGVPAFWISRQTCERLLGGTGLTYDSLVNRANGNRRGYHLSLPCRLQLESHAGIVPDASTRNVVGYLPGADPELAGQVVILGAHLDHLGVDALGRIYHGADDNASGTAMVMEIARTLAADPIPPRRSLYFCAFAGEDLGLWGSEEFVAHPPVPLDSVVAMINLDMIGVGKPEMGVGGAAIFPQIWNVWSAALSDSSKAHIQHFHAGGGSDHAAFEEKGIPAFFVDSGGDHPNYHQPEDIAALIQPAILEKIGEIAYRGLRAIADFPAPLTQADRFKAYLWQSSKTVRLANLNDPFAFADDHPGLILYEIRAGNDRTSRDGLKTIMRELGRLDTLFAARFNKVQQLKSWAAVPSGNLAPLVVLGLDCDGKTEIESELYPGLERLGASFVHISEDHKGRFFSTRGLKKAGKVLLTSLQKAPQVIFWDVPSWREAACLVQTSAKPLVIRVHESSIPQDLLSLYKGKSCFCSISAEAAQSCSRKQFEEMVKQVGIYNLGVEVRSREEAGPLLDLWCSWGYDAGRIRDLLGMDLIRWLRRISLDSPVVSR
jgi:aminopeptidase YwaD